MEKARIYKVLSKIRLLQKLVRKEVSLGEMQLLEIKKEKLLELFLQVKILQVYLNLKKRKKRHEQALFNQSKMASMGEMLRNIAHQWRQPLSTISTAASGIKVQKELGTLKEEDFSLSLDTIVDTTKYLSHTIDRFPKLF